MRILRFAGYLILALILFLGPLYGAVRIILPDWIKGQMASALPPNVKLTIGEMFSTANMGVLYKNFVLEVDDGALIFRLDDLLIAPNLSISKPANISIGKGLMKSGENNLLIKDFNADIALGSEKTLNLSLLGKITEIGDAEETILSNIEFLIHGLTSIEKSFKAKASELNLRLKVPEGPLAMDLVGIDMEGSVGKGLRTNVSAKKSKLDLSSLGAGNPNRILRGENLFLNASLQEAGEWILPISFGAKDLTSPIGHVADSLSVKAKGVWKYAQQQCTLSGMMASKSECGRMTDVIDIGIKFQEGKGNLLFSGSGHCVTPKAGCPQSIESLIQTKNTAEILSKIITSGILDPIIGGVILGALLSSPEVESLEYDHQANIKVEGNRVFLNGKPII